MYTRVYIAIVVSAKPLGSRGRAVRFQWRCCVCQASSVDGREGASAAADARSLAKLAWVAIRRTKPVHIAKPVMRGPGRNELQIQLYKTPANEHLAMPPPSARPIPR